MQLVRSFRLGLNSWVLPFNCNLHFSEFEPIGINSQYGMMASTVKAPVMIYFFMFLNLWILEWFLLILFFAILGWGVRSRSGSEPVVLIPCVYIFFKKKDEKYHDQEYHEECPEEYHEEYHEENHEEAGLQYFSPTVIMTDVEPVAWAAPSLLSFGGCHFHFCRRMGKWAVESVRTSCLRSSDWEIVA